MPPQAKSDPWEEAAKQYTAGGAKPATADAPAASGDDDWKIWQQNSPAAQQGGFLDRMSARADENSTLDPAQLEQYPKIERPFISLANGISTIPAALLNPSRTIDALAHPIDTAQQATEQMKGVPAYEAIPYLLGGAVGGGALEEGVRVPLKPVFRDVAERYGSGYYSPVIPPELQQANKIAKSIRPPGGIPLGFEEDLASELPKVKAFAGETGNPLHSQWEAAQAAKALAQKGLEHERTNLLGPFENDLISTRGTGYQGPASGEGNYASLGQINKRISDINDEIREAKRAKTVGQQLSRENNIADLEAEGKNLRELYLKELGKRTGLEPEEIGNFRQSYGKQFSIADTIDAARRARSGEVAATAERGSPTPISTPNVLQHAFDKLRGGQDYIANAKFRKYIKPIEGRPQLFPAPKPLEKVPTGRRSPVWADIPKDQK